MTNYFLKIDKELFGTGLTPLELLVVSSIAEFQRNNMDCFISDETLASDFGVSTRTVSRCINNLEIKDIITKEVKQTNKGRIRYLKLNNYGLKNLQQTN